MKMTDHTIALLFVCLGAFPCPAAESARPNIVMQWGDGSRRRLYLSVLEAMDRQLGRLFDHIRDDPQLRDNTLILIAPPTARMSMPAVPVRFEEPKRLCTKGADARHWSSGDLESWIAIELAQ